MAFSGYEENILLLFNKTKKTIFTRNVQRYNSANNRQIFHDNVASKLKEDAEFDHFENRMFLSLPICPMNRKSFSTIITAD